MNARRNCDELASWSLGRSDGAVATRRNALARQRRRTPSTRNRTAVIRTDAIGIQTIVGGAHYALSNPLLRSVR